LHKNAISHPLEEHLNSTLLAEIVEEICAVKPWCMQIRGGLWLGHMQGQLGEPVKFCCAGDSQMHLQHPADDS